MKSIRLCAFVCTLVPLLSCEHASQRADVGAGLPKADLLQALPGGWNDEVRQKLASWLEAAPASQRGPVAVFDFDNTCIRGDIGLAFFDYMITGLKIKVSDEIWKQFPPDKREKIKAAWEAAEKLPAAERAQSTELATLRKLAHQAYWSLCLEEQHEKCFPWQVRFYAGYTPEEITALAEEVLNQQLAQLLGSQQLRAGPDDQEPAIMATGIRIHPEIQSLIELLGRRGFEVWLVSAGPQWVVQAGAARLGIPAQRVLGMRTRIEEGRLTTETEPPVTFRRGKVEAIEKFIGARPYLAVGDSWADADMLEFAEHALLIDRGYADLREKAERLGWAIQPVFGSGK